MTLTTILVLVAILLVALLSLAAQLKTLKETNRIKELLWIIIVTESEVGKAYLKTKGINMEDELKRLWDT